MMMRYVKGLFFMMLMLVSAKTFSQRTSPADTFPVPKNDPYLLFYLQRQPNTNTIVVDLNVTNGKVDLDKPVNVFWRRYQEDGRKAKLNFIQKEFAYGIQAKKIDNGKYDLNFVSYKKMKFRLEKEANNTWQVFSTLKDGSRIILRRIYLHVNGGSFWRPNIEYVELKGNDERTHKEVRERIFIKE